MTSQLIPVFNGTIANETALLCNARDLHAFLGVKKVFAAWITNRISEYEFIENQDYILLSNLGKQTSGKNWRQQWRRLRSIAMTRFINVSGR